jgi:hypothetical protein
MGTDAPVGSEDDMEGVRNACAACGGRMRGRPADRRTFAERWAGAHFAAGK